MTITLDNFKVTSFTKLYTTTEIDVALLGSGSLTSSTTPTQVGGYDANDEGYWEITTPWSVYFDGVYYNKIYFTTNSYITFGAINVTFQNLSGSNPALPKIMISADDRSAQRIYYGIDGTSPNRTYRVRWEGHINDTDGILGSPTLEYEISFYENSCSQIDIHIGRNDASGTGVSGLFDKSGNLITNLIDTEYTGQRIVFQ